MAAGSPPADAAAPTADTTVGEYVFTGPFVHENLSVFVVRGRDKIKEGEFLTLAEGLRAKSVVVRETQEVNRLVVTNKSKVALYIQAGEIVKGGQQDRTLAHDAVIPPKGSASLVAYCVESGRWQQRGRESAREFSASTEMLATKSQKLASRVAKSQGAVWGSVDQAQTKIASKVGRNVKAAASPTSLQLTLEEETVKKAAEAYVSALTATVGATRDAVGLAYAVNGRVSSVDVFASHAVFAKMAPKLLKAAAVESVSEREAGTVTATASAGEFAKLMADAEGGAEEAEKVTPSVVSKKKETAKAAVLSTEDGTRQNVPIRKSYIAK